PQVPIAAALLAVLGVAAVPRGWRIDALMVGLAVVTLALPALLFRSSAPLPLSATATLAWWVAPVLAWAVSAVAIVCAVPARRAASAASRSGSAGVLCLVAVAASLASPGLTALVCTLVAAIAAGTWLIVMFGRGEIGPYAEPVADAAL